MSGLKHCRPTDLLLTTMTVIITIYLEMCALERDKTLPIVVQATRFSPHGSQALSELVSYAR